MEALADWQRHRLGDSVQPGVLYEKILKHQFSHFELSISLAEIQLTADHLRACGKRVSEGNDFEWVAWDELSRYGLPAPVEKILSMQTW